VPEIEIGKILQTCFLVGLQKLSVKFWVWRQCCKEEKFGKRRERDANAKEQHPGFQRGPPP
jgi:hypothetical protein